jgi:phosphoribosylanthranilate isomerase
MGGRVFVKVCGITSAEDGELAAAAGADAIGFVFWKMSSRRVDAEKAARISRALPPFVFRVGVFVDAPVDEMRRVADEVGLDLLQLHGDEPPEAVEALPRRVLKAVRVGKGFTAADALRYNGRVAGLLVDTRLPGETMLPGGTGVPFDWSLVRGVRERVPFLMLAGGLSPDNVQEALTAVAPDAVDVSSGVESLPGRKDPEKVRAFLKNVREWERGR